MLSIVLLRGCNTSLRRSLLQEANVNLVQKNQLRSDAKVKGVFMGRAEPKMSLKERLLKPTQGTPFAIGRAAVAAGSGLGIGALCIYGLGYTSQDAIFNQSLAWPEHVRQRIHSTFAYFGGSILLAAGSAYTVIRTPALMRLVSTNSLLAFGVTIAALIGLGSISASIPYTPGFGIKHLTWMAHSALLGAVTAPLSIVGGPLLMRAAFITAGIISSLSIVAVCAPSEQFLNWGAPLAMGLGLVFASSMASMFLAPTSALGASAFSISVYGGLLLFCGFMLYDIQKIVKRAEHTPLYSARPYDPIQNSMSVFLDTLNIFTRIVMMLGMGGNKKK